MRIAVDIVQEDMQNSLK